MCCKGFLKRVLPFFLTFAVGLLIASFFVSITPNFKFQKRGWNNKHRQYHQRIESENMRLREENNLLKRQLEVKQIMINAPIEAIEFEPVADAPPPLPLKPVRAR